MDLKEIVNSRMTTQFIEDIYSDVLHLKRQSNGNLRGQCPFASNHSGNRDNNFSIDVNPSGLGRYNCFGCDEKGNIYSYLREIKDIESPLYWMAEKLGVTTMDIIKAKNNPQKYESQKPKSVPETTSSPVEFIPKETVLKAKQTLFSDQFKNQFNRLKEIGVSEEVIRKYNIGFNPKKKRYTMPIKDESGNFVNIRQYDPDNSNGFKVISFKKGYGGNRLWPISNLDSDDIYIFEGEKDTLIALSLGLNAITSTCGAKSWNKAWAPLFKDKKVVICMDIDEDGVQGGKIRAQSIIKEAKEVKIINLPLDKDKYPSGDFANYIVDECNYKDDFLKLVDASEVFEIDEKFEKDNSGKSGSKKKITAKEIMEGIINSHSLTVPNDEFFYIYRSGLYEKISDLGVRQIIQRFIIENHHTVNVSSNMVKNIKSLIEPKLYRSDLYPNLNFINFKNGLLDLSKISFTPHSPDIFSVNQFEHNFNGIDGYSCPMWLKFLSEIFEGDKDRIGLTQEMFGYCLTPNSVYQVAFLLFGEGSNGKSVLLSILEKIVGKKNVSNLTIKDMNKRFSKAEIYNKLVNISSEMEIGLMDKSETVKAIIAGDTITIEQKHKNPFSYKPFVKLVVATNELPSTKDRTDGWYRRLIIVPFNKSFKGDEIDFTIESKLETELEGIVSWSLEGLKRLRERGKFVVPEISKEALNKYKVDNNSLLSFIDEECVKGTLFEVSKSEFVSAYRNYCVSNGLLPFSTTRLTQTFKKNSELNISVRQSGKTRFYTGIDLVENEEKYNSGKYFGGGMSLD